MRMASEGAAWLFEVFVEEGPEMPTRNEASTSRYSLGNVRCELRSADELKGLGEV
jgi:hypothetical protein